LAILVWEAAAAFGAFALGELEADAVVAPFGAFGAFAVVFGDGETLETFTGAFPLGAASIGASVRDRAIAVPAVIPAMRIGATSAAEPCNGGTRLPVFTLARKPLLLNKLGATLLALALWVPAKRTKISQ
jgi:hypothetical protein